jgi:putative transposase
VQCELLGLHRSTYYYAPLPVSAEDLTLMKQIDRQYLKTPFYGSRRMAYVLSQGGEPVNRKRVQRLMRAIYPKKTTVSAPGHKVYPYLLRGLSIERPNQVWSIDITFVPLLRGYLYLVAIIDWYSRRVLSWRVSNTMDVSFCVEALEEALKRFGKPDIFNSDQGSQFTSVAFTTVLLLAQIKISMDGRGRASDNVFIERLWKTVKEENIYIMNYETGADLISGLTKYFRFYDTERPHQALSMRTPDAVYQAGR